MQVRSCSAPARLRFWAAVECTRRPSTQRSSGAPSLAVKVLAPSSNVQLLSAFVLGVALTLTVDAGAEAGGPDPKRSVQQAAAGSSALSTDETESKPEEPSSGRRTLAAGASVVPGLLLHGSGSYVLGDEDTAQRLLLLEGAGVGLIIAGLSGLAATGASRYLSAPLIVTTAGGVSLFSLTLLADIYRVAAPPNGFGVPRQAPLLESHIGYAHVYDPVFDYRHFVHYGLRFQPNRFGLRFEAFQAPEQGNQRLRLQPSFRLWQASELTSRAVADASWLDLSFAGTLHEFNEQGFTTLTHDLLLEHRLDSSRVIPTLKGAFAEFSVGYALRRTDFTDFAVRSYDSLLLGSFGFGMYLGSARAAGGEALLYYNHRHDDFAAGFKASGLGSGVAGHVGFRGHYYFDERWGVATMTEVGSAWVLGLGLRIRVLRD